MLKRFFVVLAIALVILLVLCWIYFPSISRYRELKLEEERLGKKIQEIDSQIKVLTDERTLLQTDVTYLEKVIREELGFVKPGEIVYELVTKKNTPGQATGTATATAVKTETDPANGSKSKPGVEKVAETPISVKKSVAAIASAKKNSTASRKKTSSSRHTD